MKPGQNWSRAVLMVAVFGAGTSAILAQGGPEPAGGSMATLIAEVRQLRQSVEESAKSQLQTQALGVYLAAQQSRWVQVQNQLEAVRAEIAGAAVQTQAVSRVLASAQAEQAQAASPAESAEASEMIRWFKQQVDQATERDRKLRQRESELVLAYQTEESRWADLISQLERLIKR